ncbi:hypothetical protein JNB11_06215 [Kocuria palustris]|nr:hypothetical protein [Kocuria palustris]
MEPSRRPIRSELPSERRYGSNQRSRSKVGRRRPERYVPIKGLTHWDFKVSDHRRSRVYGYLLRMHGIEYDDDGKFYLKYDTIEHFLEPHLKEYLRRIEWHD